MRLGKNVPGEDATTADSCGTAFKPRPEEVAQKEEEGGDLVESVTKNVETSAGRPKAEGLTEEDCEEARRVKQNNADDARGVILSKEEQEQEDKEEEARLSYANIDPATYKQMLTNNPQAQAGYYYGEQKITFSQQNVDETKEFQRQQQPSSAQDHHNKCGGESKESNSKAGQEDGEEPPAADHMPG